MKNHTHTYQRGFGITLPLLVLALALVGGSYWYRNSGTEEVTLKETVLDMVDAVRPSEQISDTASEPVDELSAIRADADLSFIIGEYKEVMLTLDGAEGNVTWEYEQNPAPGLSFKQPPAPGYACITEPCPYVPPKELILGGRATKSGTYTTELSVRDGAGKTASRTLTIVVVGGAGCPQTTDANGVPLSDSVTGKYRGTVQGAVVLETDGPAPLTSKTSYIVTADVQKKLQGVSGGTTITLYSYVQNALSGANPPYSCVEVVGE